MRCKDNDMKEEHKVCKWNKGQNSSISNSQVRNLGLNSCFFTVEIMPTRPRFKLFSSFFWTLKASPKQSNLNSIYLWSFLVFSSSLFLSLRVLFFILLRGPFLRNILFSFICCCPNLLSVLLLVPIKLFLPSSLSFFPFLFANLLFILELSTNFLFLFLF